MKQLFLSAGLALIVHALFLTTEASWLRRPEPPKIRSGPMTLSLNYAKAKKPTSKAIQNSDVVKKEALPAPIKETIEEKTPVKPPKIEKKEVVQKPLKNVKIQEMPSPEAPPKSEPEPKPIVKPKPRPKIKKKPEIPPKPIAKPKPKTIKKAQPKPRPPPKKLKKKPPPPRVKAVEKIKTPARPPETKILKQEEPRIAMNRDEPFAPEFYSESDSSESEKEVNRLASVTEKNKGLKMPAGALEEKASLPEPKPMKLAIPLYKENPRPEYPRRARRRGYEGTVFLEVFVREDGKVMEIKLSQSSGHDVLDRAAMKSVKKWVFEPGMRGVERVDMWVKVPIRFQLK